MNSSQKKTIIVVAMALVVGLVLGIAGMRWWQKNSATDAGSERKVLYYKNPMGSGHVSATPMKDEMGMDYIPVYEGEGASQAEPAGTVSISPTVVQNIGVRTAPVTQGKVATEVVANGVIALDETRTTTVTTKVDGYVEKLYVTAVGKTVNKGDPLFDLYSPDLAALLEEFLAALRYQESIPATASPAVHRNATELVVAAHSRLQLLGLAREQIAQIQAQRSAPRAITFYANSGGVVLKKNVLQGGYVAAATELFTLADLSAVWVLAEVYAQDFAALRVGQRAKVTVQGIPGRTYEGRIDFIYPTMDTQTRTVKVRVALPNPQGILRPDMYVSVAITSGASENKILVPKSAVLRTGKQDLVIVALGEGRFRPQQVRLGGEGGENYIVASGLKLGDTVVTSAQFLLDSESKINEAVQKLSEQAPAAAPINGPSNPTISAPIPSAQPPKPQTGKDNKPGRKPKGEPPASEAAPLAH